MTDSVSRAKITLRSMYDLSPSSFSGSTYLGFFPTWIEADQTMPFFMPS